MYTHTYIIMYYIYIYIYIHTRVDPLRSPFGERVRALPPEVSDTRAQVQECESQAGVVVKSSVPESNDLGKSLCLGNPLYLEKRPRESEE